MNEPTIKFVSLNEVARLSKVNHMTARRRFHGAGVIPDALLCGGSSSNEVPLFLQERVPQIEKIITTKPI